jgi:phage terminase small subunit
MSVIVGETENSLTAKQARAIVALLTARTVSDAAIEAGVSARQLGRWLGDETFRAELQRAQDEAIGAAVRRFSGGLAGVQNTLQDVMNDKDTPAGVKVRAALGWADAGRAWLETLTLAERVTKLEEEALNGK